MASAADDRRDHVMPREIRCRGSVSGGAGSTSDLRRSFTTSRFSPSSPCRSQVQILLSFRWIDYYIIYRFRSSSRIFATVSDPEGGNPQDRL